MPNEARNETQVQYHRRRVTELKSGRTAWEGAWQPLADYINPVRLRLGTLSEGAVSRKKIVDAAGTFALRTLASGMHSGLTSPARPWFKLQTGDPKLREFGPVKDWVDAVERRMREILQQSNVYTCFHQGYSDLGLFGQSCGLLVEDDDRIIRMIQLVHGTFWIARDENGVATTCYRRMRWSVQKIVARFGYDNCSQQVQQAYDSAKYDMRFDIWHAVEPRLNRDETKLDKRNKPFLSNYWEDLGNENGMLEESGFDANPIIAPPWERVGDDDYAFSPGMDALADVMMLQKEQANKLEAIDKIVRPPMQGPTSLMNNPKSMLPGSVTYVDDPTGKGFRPTMEVNLRLSELNLDIKETRERVNQCFYADLFLMLANMEGVQPRNQLEISERKEEKLLALGPVLENIYNGQLEPAIDRLFETGMRRGEFPPPPREVQDQTMTVEYISILAQAQKAVATGAIERFVGFVGNLAGARPDVLDKADFDQAVDVYAEHIGVPPSLVVPDEKVAQARAARAQKQQQAEAAQMAATAAPATKEGVNAARLLAEAPGMPGGPALLERLGLTP